MTRVDLRALLEAATPTPWKVKKSRSRIAIDSPPSLSVCEISGAIDAPRVDEDAALIVAAVNSLPHLLDAAEALRWADDLLRRLAEWDMLYVRPDGTPITADAPYWQAEIAKAREMSGAALSALDEQEPR